MSYVRCSKVRLRGQHCLCTYVELSFNTHARRRWLSGLYRIETAEATDHATVQRHQPAVVVTGEPGWNLICYQLLAIGLQRAGAGLMHTTVRARVCSVCLLSAGKDHPGVCQQPRMKSGQAIFHQPQVGPVILDTVAGRKPTISATPVLVSCTGTTLSLALSSPFVECAMEVVFVRCSYAMRVL